MAPDRRNQILLVGLGVILTAAVYRAWSITSEPPLPSSNGLARSTAGPARRTAAATPDVRLEQLDAERPKPVAADRNLFRFKAKPAPAPPPPPVASGPGGVNGAPPVPQVPPIALKFIGIVERPEKAQKLALLRDPSGHVLSGTEGGVVEGRFRILRIGAESIEMAYLDGRGRQTIRLSGG
jgi:hypothetical protein